MKTLVLCLLVASAFAAPSGKPQFQRGRNMIVGGTDAKPGELPYQVSFQFLSDGFVRHICGGSIYNENTVITAANCVEGHDFNNPTDLQIAAGDTDITTDEGTEQTIAVAKVIRHEDYDVRTLANDVVLLKLATPLIFNDYVKPINLPKPMQIPTENALVSGWGYDTYGGVIQCILQKVTVPIIADDVCQKDYELNLITDSMMCAGKGGKGVCYGDAGGPLVCSSDGETYLCGILSWGVGCAFKKYPAVYTQVSLFVDWIKANAW